jgi:threonine dehydrogenase-like Zn-dependent dehydrogenase
MRRVVAYPGRIAVETAGIPAPGPNEALVRTLAAGVCGSDLHAARGRHPFVALPYRPGHEVVGIIEAAGSAAAGAVPGQRVIVQPFLPCWTCKMCASGRENLCENLQFFGCGYPQGGMADYFTLPADRPIVQDHQIRIQGSATYLAEDYAESTDLLSRGAVRTADFVTATRPLAQVAEAFELASSGNHVKVLITVGE